MSKGKWDGWEVVGSGDEPMHDFQQDKVLIGVFVEVRENIGENNSNIYVFEKKDGNRVGVWGSTVLDARLKNLVVGEEVGIEYLGKQKPKSGGKEYHNYNIYRRPMKSVENNDDLPFD